MTTRVRPRTLRCLRWRRATARCCAGEGEALEALAGATARRLLGAAAAAWRHLTSSGRATAARGSKRCVNPQVCLSCSGRHADAPRCDLLATAGDYEKAFYGYKRAVERFISGIKCERVCHVLGPRLAEGARSPPSTHARWRPLRIGPYVVCGVVNAHAVDMQTCVLLCRRLCSPTRASPLPSISMLRPL